MIIFNLSKQINMNIQWKKNYLTNSYNIAKNLKNVKITYGVWYMKLKKIFITLEGYIEFLKKTLKSSCKKFFFKQSIKQSVSKKSIESRMGGGKGKNLYNLFVFKYGNILLEYYNIYIYIILYLFKLISYNQKNHFKFLKKKYL